MIGTQPASWKPFKRFLVVDTTGTPGLSRGVNESRDLFGVSDSTFEAKPISSQINKLTVKSFPRIFVLTLALSLAFASPGCRAFRPGTDSNSGSLNSEVVTSKVPPFATREPERYQAVRVVTFSESSPAGPTTERSSRVSIARDGEKRREEYFIGSIESIVYLEIPKGLFVLLPSSGIYADMKAVENESRVDLTDETASLSADLLLNEGFSASSYEKVGTESLDGRTTTKYRVTSPAASQDGGNFETLIWIDESLGMPVRSESISAAGDRSSKATMELKSITLEVDEDLFTLPPSYRKVDSTLVLNRIRKSRSRTSSSVGKE